MTNEKDNRKAVKLNETQTANLKNVNLMARCDHKVVRRPATNFFQAGFDVIRLSDSENVGGSLTIDAAISNAWSLYRN